MGIEGIFSGRSGQLSPGYSPLPGPVDSGRVAVLGLGNILLSDEGIGIHAVTELRKRYRFSPSIDLIDGGTMGLDLLPLFQDRDRILIIDAVDFGEGPGHTRLVEGEAIRSVLNIKLSVHHIGLGDLLFAARLIRKFPPDVCLVGIQPESLTIGLVMTGRITGKMERLLNIALQKLNAWNISFEQVRS